MERRELTCIECPLGCLIEVTVEGGKPVFVAGNSCPRGKMYAENEVVCPRRVLTTTVRTAEGKMLPVKTERPVKKSEIFDLMIRIGEIHPAGEINIGDVIYKNITEDINLVASGTAI